MRTPYKRPLTPRPDSSPGPQKPDHLSATLDVLFSEIRHLRQQLADADTRNADRAARIAVLEERIAILERGSHPASLKEEET